MRIYLQRLWAAGDPAYIQHDGHTTCGVCHLPFEEDSVIAWGTTDVRTDMGLICPSCIEYLGRRNPEKFPTIEVFRELLAKYPEAMYPSAEALEAAGEAAGYEDPSELVYEPSFVWMPRESAPA